MGKTKAQRKEDARDWNERHKGRSKQRKGLQRVGRREGPSLGEDRHGHGKDRERRGNVRQLRKENLSNLR